MPILLLPLLWSCAGAAGKFRVMAGNLFFGGNRYAEAIGSYLDALGYGESVPYAEYGLGVIYQAMNENDAALGRFTAAAEAADGEAHEELRYRIHYNAGIVRFGQGDFAGAAAEFREALENAGGHVEAKRNLELSLLSLERQSREAEADRPEPADTGTNDVLFDYMRRKEEERWRSQEWGGDVSVSGPDY